MGQNRFLPPGKHEKVPSAGYFPLKKAQFERTGRVILIYRLRKVNQRLSGIVFFGFDLSNYL
jgi:hypothetical protein